MKEVCGGVPYLATRGERGGGGADCVESSRRESIPWSSCIAPYRQRRCNPGQRLITRTVACCVAWYVTCRFNNNTTATRRRLPCDSPPTFYGGAVIEKRSITTTSSISYYLGFVFLHGSTDSLTLKSTLENLTNFIKSVFMTRLMN